MIKMRSNVLLLLSFVIIFTIIIGGDVSATECISLKLAKISYIPQETVQVEIDTNTMRDIAQSDVFLYKGDMKLPVNIFISKVSGVKYFSWFDLPYNAGDYSIKVRGTCKDGSFYVFSLSFKVEQSIASKYQDFKTLVSGKFSTMTLEEHLLGAMALAHDSEIQEQALTKFVERQNSCVNTNCSTKLNSMTMMAFKDSLLRQRMLDSLEASQNYVNKGLWKLQLTSSSSQECNLLINNETSNLSLVSGLNVLDLNFGNFTTGTISVKTDCVGVVGKLIYSYKQFSKDFILLPEGISLNNNGCFAPSLSDVFVKCDNEATTYSLLTLAKTGKFNSLDTGHLSALSWLARNAASVDDKAAAYYITRDSNELAWLLNSQTGNGWWPKSGVYQPDIKSSSIALFALKNYAGNENETTQTILAIELGENWLINQFNSASMKDKATILAFAFQEKDIEPLLAIWPGIIKTQSLGSFDLILQNKGLQNISINANLLNSTNAIELKANSMKNIKFNVPLLTTVDGRAIIETLALNYQAKNSEKTFSYNVPLLIFTQKSSQEQLNGSINASEEEINESEQQEIINGTQELENETAEINESLLKNFKFVEKNIIKEVEAGESFTVTIRLANDLDEDLEDVSLSYSSSLILMGGTIRIEPNTIKTLAKDSAKTITIYFAPTSSGTYSGEITAKADYKGEEINTEIPIDIEITPGEVEEKNCSDMGGKICADNEICKVNVTTSSDSFACCIPSSNCKKKEAPGTIVALIIVFIVIVVLLVVFYLLRKKPKKEMKEFLEETSKQYEKRFQRAPSISRL